MTQLIGVEPRAAVWHGVGRPFSVETIPAPVQTGAGEVVVEIGLATVCGSDVHTVRGHRPGPLPSILGHEQVGRIVAIDPRDPPRAVDGSPLALGDRVVWSVTVSCGTCRRCVAGIPQKCLRLRKYGHERLSEDWPLNGGFATHCILLPGTAIVHVPAGLADEAAAPAACATATVAAALVAAHSAEAETRGGSPLAGLRVLVTGAGMLGVTAVAMAAAEGALVTAVDPFESRRETALRFGATEVAASAEGIDDVDVAIELSGHPDAVEAAVGSLGVGGRAVLVGAVSSTRAARFDPEQVVRRLNTIVGVHNYRAEHLQAAVDFLAGTDRQFAELVDRPLALDDVELATTGPAAGRFLRRALRPTAVRG